MVECTLGNTSMIRNTDMVSIAGKTAESTKDSGIMASSTVLVSTLSLRMPQNPNLDSGRMAKELNGSLRRRRKKSTKVTLTISSTLNCLIIKSQTCPFKSSINPMTSSKVGLMLI